VDSDYAQLASGSGVNGHAQVVLRVISSCVHAQVITVVSNTFAGHGKISRTRSKRFDVYVALGAGDTYAAIRDLTRVAAREPAELAAGVVAALGAWWATHEDTDDHYEAAHVAELRALPEPQPPPRDIKPLCINRKYLRPNRTR
jgi:hypothetical protein